ncbi:MAG: Ig-like domain-containing protein [Gemmatimonadaceae bacterium]|nr:Ig-like domain-containing protein [Gemmatimonadaceae bacterium]
MHPLFNRWSKTTAAITLVLVGACSPDQSVTSSLDLAEVSSARSSSNYASATLSGEVNLLVGSSTKLTVRTSSRSRGSVKWTSSNSNAASVNSTGTVTGRAAGSTYVTASGFAVDETYLVTVTPAFRLTGFAVSPMTGTALAPAQTRQFSTTQTWSDGQTRNYGVTYTATGGTISSSGLFTAGNVAGSFMVIANCLCGALDTAFVTVELPAQLTRVTVSPKTVSLTAGATQQFAASALWSTGATTLPPVTWSATAGSVTSAGLYTAPATAGTYRVILAHTGGTARDTAVVTVTATTTPPPVPPPSGSVACPNEPSGYQQYADGALSSLLAPTGFSYWGENKSVVNDATAPGGSSVLAWRKPAGTAAGQLGYFNTLDLTSAPRAVYSCIVFKRSENYVEHPSGTKFIYPFVSTASGYQRPFQFAMLPVDGTTSGKFQWMIEMFSGDRVSGLRPSNMANAPMSNGKWYRLEFLAVSNTVGGQNSVLRWWTSEWNGSGWNAPVLNGSYSDVMMTATGSGHWTSWDYNMYYGGSGGTPIPSDQFIYMSRARVSVSSGQ